MGRWQPYSHSEQTTSLYDEPVFNPKAVTMASRQPPPPPKKKPEGPLIDFNKHPDSYLILPYGNTNAKPMHPKTNIAIKTTRWIQFGFRVLTLLGAVGALLCAIFVRGAQLTEGYLIRIPPGIDIVNTLYAIYHLLRSAKSRPAGSSASYHFFALLMDAGFIPFYVFTALLSKRNYNQEAGTDGRWRTFFPTDEETDKVLRSTWLIAVAVAGLHLASLCLDMYLVLVFRKIANLPPDMNPLEENLTSRRKTKHKYKNSSLSAITPLTADEKRFSTQSSFSVLGTNRNSQADPLISEKEIPMPDAKQMAFTHTRTNSEQTYSPHTPESARYSRIYAQPASAQASRAQLNHRDDLHRRDDGSDNETLAQRKSYLAQQANIKRNSRPNSMVSSKQEVFYTPPSTGNKPDSGDISLQQETLRSDNWFVHEGEFDEPEVIPPKKSVLSSKGYNAVSMNEELYDDEFERPLMPQLIPQPLRMNPPTPPPARPYETEETQQAYVPQEYVPQEYVPQAYVPLERMPTASSTYSDATVTRSPSHASIPKTRFYGDLKTATQKIRNGQSSSNLSGASPTKNGFTANSLPSATKQYTTNSPIAPKATSSPFTLDPKSFASVRRTGETGYTPVRGHSPRVVSRTGVDYMDYDGRYDFEDDSDLGTSGRRREVSGKVAEEGRGGCGVQSKGWGIGRNELTYRKVSGVA